MTCLPGINELGGISLKVINLPDQESGGVGGYEPLRSMDGMAEEAWHLSV